MSAPESVQITLPDGALAGWPVVVDALRRAQSETGLQMIFGGLIEQITRQALKPAEPQGLGAVVEAADGRRWVRSKNITTVCHWKPAEGGTRKRWDHLPSDVTVLSEGVTP